MVEVDLDRVRRLVNLHEQGLDAEGGGPSRDGWETDGFRGQAGLKGAISDLIEEVAYLRVPPPRRPTLYSSSDLERAHERIKELEAENLALRSQRQVLTDSERDLNARLYDSEEERLKACENAGNLQLRFDESLRREGALNTRLSNLDTLAKDAIETVKKMASALDKSPSST